jgi:hypothetical protein
MPYIRSCDVEHLHGQRILLRFLEDIALPQDSILPVFIESITFPEDFWDQEVFRHWLELALTRPQGPGLFLDLVPVEFDESVRDATVSLILSCSKNLSPFA